MLPVLGHHHRLRRLRRRPPLRRESAIPLPPYIRARARARGINRFSAFSIPPPPTLFSSLRYARTRTYTPPPATRR